ncbi:hypothetical protein [Streptomyces sp. NPDC047123]|uniref:hypothetical protein n=1 Tax=unclassified Streptomyces TaxID=2593676 RepID=UPI0033FC472B
MEHSPGAAWLTEAAQAAEQQGPGNLLRIVLIVMVVGCVLVGWFLLRGYRRTSDSGSVRGADSAPDRSPARTPGEAADPADGQSADGTSDKGPGHRNG